MIPRIHSSGPQVGGMIPGIPSNPKPAVLASWKEIATYLGKGVRTVQRWEARLGLPVRRPLGPAAQKGVVLARCEDLDRWLESEWGKRAKQEHPMTKDLDYCQGLCVAIRTQARLLQEQLELRQQTTDEWMKLRQRVSETARNLKRTKPQLGTYWVSMVKADSQTRKNGHASAGTSKQGNAA